MAIVEDWISVAAKNIRSTFKLNWPKEDVLTHVIGDACPFKRDVAYMPVPRCDGCKHWHPYPLNAYSRPVGDCANIIIYSDPTVNRDSERMLGTAADFGCVRWEAK